MTDTDDTAAPSGEHRLRRRRASFWRYIVLAVLAAMALGFVGGYAVALAEQGAIPRWTIYWMLALLIAGFVWFSWDYFRRVDELDLLDNLWASMIGLFVYLIAYPAWSLLHDADLAPPPDQFVIYAATFLTVLGVYLARKLGWR